MEIEELLRNQIKKLDVKNPQNYWLIKHLLEYWATLKDKEINNRLLHDLIFKYALAEKKLAKLNQELLDKQKRLDEDLAAAAEIQKNLLPQKTIAAENLEIAWEFLPCEHMGGDIFNIFQLDADHWGIYMLDVGEHGVPAAMITVSASQFLQPFTGYLLHRDPECLPNHAVMPPCEVLSALDMEFPFDRFNNFFTITYIIINTKTGLVKGSNAGHPHPVLIRKGGKMEFLAKGGPIIGMGEFPMLNAQIKRFEEKQLQIYPGDKLFVYTDGIVEYQNPNEEFYGTRRFYGKLNDLKEKSIHDIVDLSIKSLMEFGHNTKPQDDMTLLGVGLIN